MRTETYSIVGTRYRGGEAQKIVNSSDRGTLVRLVRDPYNEFDRNAVQIWIRGTHVGYVLASEAILLAHHMDARNKTDLVGMYTFTSQQCLGAGRDFWPGVRVELGE